jgi:hypothetical protein
MIERAIHPAGPDHQVVAITGAKGTYRRSPCEECPWRRDVPIGAFPAEAYRHSARTAYDMSSHVFSCHMSGAERLATCAGFLLKGAGHNLSVRMARSEGRCLDVSSDAPLYDNYREMAMANGVAADDDALAPCRS